LLASSRSMTKIVGSGSISQRHGFADSDPDPHQNVMVPQHCKWHNNRLKDQYRYLLQEGEGGCCSLSCLKFSLYIYNIVALVSGLALLAVSLWILLDSEHAPYSSFSSSYTLLAWAALGVYRTPVPMYQRLLRIVLCIVLDRNFFAYEPSRIRIRIFTGNYLFGSGSGSLNLQA
jgi:hypothetical protein